MKTKYLKYRSVEEILDALNALPFKEFKKKQIERILTSNSPLEYKVKTILEQRNWGKTFEMLVHAILKGQEEKVLIVAPSLDSTYYVKTTLYNLLEKLELTIADNFSFIEVDQPKIGFTNIFIDSCCKLGKEQLDNFKVCNLYYKPTIL